MPKKESPPSSGTTFEIAGVIIIAVACLLAAGLLDFSVGRVGYFSAKVLRYGFGAGAGGFVIFLFIIGLFERDMTCATFPGMRCELDLFGGVQRRIPGNVALREPRIVANAGNTQSCGPLRLDAGRLD